MRRVGEVPETNDRDQRTLFVEGIPKTPLGAYARPSRASAKHSISPILPSARRSLTACGIAYLCPHMHRGPRGGDGGRRGGALPGGCRLQGGLRSTGARQEHQAAHGPRLRGVRVGAGRAQVRPSFRVGGRGFRGGVVGVGVWGWSLEWAVGVECSPHPPMGFTPSFITHRTLESGWDKIVVLGGKPLKLKVRPCAGDGKKAATPEPEPETDRPKQTPKPSDDLTDLMHQP